MAVQDKLYTFEEYLKYCDLPENADRRFELIEGVIQEVPPSSPKNTVLAVWIAYLLVRYAAPENLGYVSGADGGYKVGSNTTLVPDVGFVTRTRVPDLSGSIFTVAPDLAVEVISPSETERKILTKAQNYLRLGTKLVWAVYPEEKVVDVYRPADNEGVNVQTVDIHGTLDGGDVLPGFTLAVSEIFKGL